MVVNSGRKGKWVNIFTLGTGMSKYVALDSRYVALAIKLMVPEVFHSHLILIVWVLFTEEKR